MLDMMYLYHWVPDNFQGDTLIPLNELRSIYPDVYEQAVKKYAGREDILTHHIPVLNCLWNDVIHLSAVHPSKIKEALYEAGRTKPFTLEYFEIDPHLLDPEKAIVLLYKHVTAEEKQRPENYAPFDPDNLKQYSEVPEGTKVYYKQMFTEGKGPLLYHKVPHILYRGRIATTGLTKIIP